MKNTTPMQVLKPLLTLFKNLQGFTLIELNGKKGGTTFVGSTMYKSKPVTFDYIAILGTGGIYHDLGSHKRFVNTISLAFSYTDRETAVVRAGVGIQHRVDYSAEIDVSTAKNLLTVFLENPTIDHFVKTFSILQSSKLNDSDIRQFKAPYLEKVDTLKLKLDTLNESLRIKRNQYYALKGKGKSAEVQKEVEHLHDQVKTLQQELRSIFKEDTKNMPYVVRHSFNKETEQVQFRYT